MTHDKALATATAQIRRARDSASHRPSIAGFFDEATNTVSYVVHDPATKEAAIIDSVLDFEAASGRTSNGSADLIIEYITSNNLKVMWLIETHAHADHISAAPYLQDKLGGKLAIGREIIRVQEVFGKLFNAGTDFERDGSQFDKLFDDGETFQIGELEGIALHVPGHTPADMAFIIGDAAFVGDTIFMPDFGTARADFPGGDAHQLFRSIRRLLSLPDATRLFLCHDYKAPGRDDYAWETTVKQQREENVHVKDGVTEEDFVAMRTSRDKTLDMPKLIMPSVQVNIRGRQTARTGRQWCELHQDTGERGMTLPGYPEAAPLAGLAGGVLIGLAAAVMLLGLGRIAGVSGHRREGVGARRQRDRAQRCMDVRHRAPAWRAGRGWRRAGSKPASRAPRCW